MGVAGNKKVRTSSNQIWSNFVEKYPTITHQPFVVDSCAKSHQKFNALEWRRLTYMTMASFVYNLT